MYTKILSTGGILGLGLFFYFQTYTNTESFIYNEGKINGLSFVAPSKVIGDSAFSYVKSVNANWISIMPYSFLPQGKATVKYADESDANISHKQWWGETVSGVRECIKMAKSQNLKVMVKPHLWLGSNDFTGHMDFKDDKDWEAFEASFGAYILQFAKVAEEEKAEVFSIATEMENHVKERPEYWFNLIKEVKKIYSGKITYAENWDSYTRVPFWNELDFIGVDGYFPLSDKKQPSIENIQKGWKKHINEMEKLASKYQKPILFTEIGYRSCDYTTQRPWETNYDLPINEKLQADAYVALFKEVWPQKWFAGGFIWKWFPILSKNPRHKDIFSPQNKIAESTLKNYFSKSN